MKRLLIFSTVVFCSHLHADPVDQLLQNFADNPKKAMMTPPKHYVSGTEDEVLRAPFYLLPHTGDCQGCRDKIIKQSDEISGRVGIMAAGGGNDRADLFIEAPQVISNIEDMAKLGLAAGALNSFPWSDWYWPLYQGALGARFEAMGFPGDPDWKTNKDFITANPAAEIVDKEIHDQLLTLSPGEKYDLIVGNSDWGFTANMWQQGQRYYDRNGEVESWMGLCHGWAPASYKLPRPQTTIEVIAADNHTKVTFYPSDLKALATDLWAVARTPVKFAGGRCNDKDPEVDENGRVISPDCFDSNPGTWHQVVVNQIGALKRAFIMDATFDYQVWNQPVTRYSYGYFNPLTMSRTEKLEEGLIKKSDYNNDKFAKYRSPNAEYIVGVAMEVEYLVETAPNHNEVDSPNEDRTHTVYYLYDLELDKDKKIIGGEWYNNAHPDFLWTPTLGARALTSGDYYIDNPQAAWDGKKPMPANWQDIGAQAADFGQPLGTIVERLLQFSQVMEEDDHE